MPSPISSAAHYLSEKEKYKELILDNVSFDNNIDFYSGINDFKKKTHVELIEYFITNANNKVISDYKKIRPKDYLITKLNNELLAQKKKWLV